MQAELFPGFDFDVTFDLKSEHQAEVLRFSLSLANGFSEACLKHPVLLLQQLLRFARGADQVPILRLYRNSKHW